MGLCDQQKLSVRSDQAAGLLCEQCGGMLATTWQPCANNVLNGWQGWWRQCGHPVATVCSHGGDSVALRPMLPHSTHNNSSQEQF